MLDGWPNQLWESRWTISNSAIKKCPFELTSILTSKLCSNGQMDKLQFNTLSAYIWTKKQKDGSNWRYHSVDLNLIPFEPVRVFSCGLHWAPLITYSKTLSAIPTHFLPQIYSIDHILDDFIPQNSWVVLLHSLSWPSRLNDLIPQTHFMYGIG